VQINNLSDNLNSLGKESIPSLLNLEIVKIGQLEIKEKIRTSVNPYITKEDLQRQIKKIEESRTTYKKALEEYDKIERTPEEDKLYKEFLQKLEISKNFNDKLIEELKKLEEIENKTQKEAICAKLTTIAVGGDVRKAFDDALDSLQKLLEYVKTYYGHEMVDNAISSGKQASVMAIIIIIVAVVFAMLIAFFLGNAIARPVNKISDDLSISANNLEKASNQVASASQELSSGASELASSVEEITSSMEELQSIIESNTKSVNEAEILMKETLNTAKTSQMETEELSRLMAEVTETSKKIVKINKVIDDIAFQTNILALNAAVEAARAGDVGRGFAVVAEQVKALAQKSADSSKETSELIEAVADSVSKSAEKTENTVTSFKEVVTRAEKVNILLDEITRASKEQAKGANQVTKAISQVNSVVQELAASSEETASSSEEMLGQVESMKEMVLGLSEVANGAKEAKRLSQESNAATDKQDLKDISKRAHKVHEAVDSIKLKNNNAEKKDDVELIRPEDKIPLNDFKDF
jgi:methyl-accepting chemotaxis protein